MAGVFNNLGSNDFPGLNTQLNETRIFVTIADTSKNPDETFVKSGFKKWKTALDSGKGFTKHQGSEYHNSAMATAMYREEMEKSGKTITQLLTDDVLIILRQYYNTSRLSWI